MLFSRLASTVRTHGTRIAQGVPSLCAVCRSWGTQRVCRDCVARFAPDAPRCERCAVPVMRGTAVCGACITAPPPFARAIAAVDYAYPWDRLVQRFKFHDALDLAPALAQRLIDAVGRREGTSADWLLPVPLSAARLRERGFNQAWELARRLAAPLGGVADPHLLLRVKDTPHQLSLPPARRAANVRAAFAIEPRRLAEIRGRSVALVDDVMTTGATVSEAARTLLQAGAREVAVWVVARTPLDEPV